MLCHTAGQTVHPSPTDGRHAINLCMCQSYTFTPDNIHWSKPCTSATSHRLKQQATGSSETPWMKGTWNIATTACVLVLLWYCKTVQTCLHITAMYLSECGCETKSRLHRDVTCKLSHTSKATEWTRWKRRQVLLNTPPNMLTLLHTTRNEDAHCTYNLLLKATSSIWNQHCHHGCILMFSFTNKTKRFLPLPHSTVAQSTREQTNRDQQGNKI